MKKEEAEPRMARMPQGSILRMVVAGVIANLPALSIGLSHGFPAILIPQLQAPDSDIQISLEEGSWIASLFILGDLVGCVIGGFIADRWGRRIAVCLDCLPLVVCWVLMQQSTSLAHLLIARTIFGLGTGANTPVTIYLREISTPELRGSLAIIMPIFCNLGYLTMYILGYCLPWRLTTFPGMFVPLLTLTFMYFLPETPIWLLKNGRSREAEANLCLLRGLQPEHVAAELAELREVSSLQGEGRPRTSWRNLLHRTTLLPMALLVYLFFTQSFSGSNMVSYYTVTILKMADIPIDENFAAILVAAQYFLGYTLSSYFVTRIPRRVMLLSSLVMMGLANTAAGLVLLRNKYSLTLVAEQTGNETHYHHHHFPVGDAEQIGLLDQLTDLPDQLTTDLADQLTAGLPDQLTGGLTGQLTAPAGRPDQLADEEAAAVASGGVQVDPVEKSLMDQLLGLVPVISCILITLSYGLGLGPVPWVLFGELFPSSVRGMASSLTAFLRSITIFLSIKMFPSLLDLFGIGGSFICSAFVCFLAIGVSYFAVPETKGMDTKQLENIYKKVPAGNQKRAQQPTEEERALV